MKRIIIAGLFLFIIPVIFSFILFFFHYKNFSQALEISVIEGVLAVVIILGGLKLCEYLSGKMYNE